MKGVKTAWVILAVGRKRHIDKIGINAMECFEVDLQSLGYSRAIVFDKDICTSYKLVKTLKHFLVF